MKYIKKFSNETQLDSYKKSNFVSPHIYFDSNLKTINLMQKYEILEYISSTATGGQYIDLGCKLFENTDDFRINIKFSMKGSGKDNVNQSTLIGNQIESSPYPGFTLRCQGSPQYLNYIMKWNSGDNYAKESGKETYYIKEAYNLDQYDNYNSSSGKYLYIDGVLQVFEFNTLFHNIPSSQINQMTTHLFCGVNSSSNLWRFVEADLYYLKITKGGQVIRNLIPVKKETTNEIGLYDIENDHFYISQGDEPFVPRYKYKNDDIIHNISYLQGTGTQWIDTLIHPITGYGFELYGGFTNFDNNEFFGGGNEWSNGLGICTYRDGLYGIVVGNTQVCSITATNNVMHLFKVNSDGTVYVDNEYKGQSNTEMPDGDYTINIFKHSTNNNPRCAKIYYCKIFNDNNELIFDGIPVRKNGIGDMYDKVTNKLFENSGTGEFILGPDI